MLTKEERIPVETVQEAVKILKRQIGKKLTNYEAQKMAKELREHGEYHFSSWYKLGAVSARIE